MYERATVAINTSVLFFEKVTRPKTSCEKQVVVQSEPDLALVGLKFCPKFNKSHAVPKIPGEGCSYCAAEGGVIHSMPHTQLD